jgi:uncharacterized membrane protein YecN with MAPEG domain
VPFGDGGNAELMAASRAFGNAAEYIPPRSPSLILMALTGFQPVGTLAVPAAVARPHARLGQTKQPSFGGCRG